MVGPLTLLGFGAEGIIVGSTAAAWQSSIALANGVGVVSGSLFAFLQSAGMTGAWGVFGWFTGAGSIVAALIATMWT